jgi:hypothetical protein
MDPDATYASKADLARMAEQHDAWMDSIDTSHIKPLGDDWKDHPMWADEAALQNTKSPAGKVMHEMQKASTPEERAESCKVTFHELAGIPFMHAS